MDETTTAVADAPASSAPSSAPTSTPSEPTVTTDRPSIGDALSVFNEAAKQQGRKTRGTITPTGDPSATDPPILPADGLPRAPIAASPAGPIPFPVHQKALDNARLKARQDVEQEYRATVGDPAVAREATQWFQRAARDRVGFLRDVITEALADPQLAAQVRSLAGQTLGGGRGPMAAAPTEAPAPDFQDANGNQFYSAKTQQARDEWLIQRAREEILGQVQPDLEQVRTERLERQADTAKRQVVSAIQGHISEATKWPYFEQYKAQIAHVARTMPLTSGHPAEEAIVLRRAYDQVVGPQLSTLEQQRVMADLKARAHASSLNPASTGAPSGIPKAVRAKDGGTFGAALQWAQAQQSGR